MQTRRSSHRRREHTARSSARLALALTLAGPACAGDFGPIEEHRDPFLADVYLVNDTHADVTVWLHRLDPER
ncbi:MAG: hypothetical protein KC636_06235, partial [Myxococcales bacterium]|nr:hypothetical protein [Myxococcales bacterium]